MNTAYSLTNVMTGLAQARERARTAVADFVTPDLTLRNYFDQADPLMQTETRAARQTAPIARVQDTFDYHGAKITALRLGEDRVIVFTRKPNSPMEMNSLTLAAYKLLFGRELPNKIQ